MPPGTLRKVEELDKAKEEPIEERIDYAEINFIGMGGINFWNRLN